VTSSIKAQENQHALLCPCISRCCSGGRCTGFRRYSRRLRRNSPASFFRISCAPCRLPHRLSDSKGINDEVPFFPREVVRVPWYGQTPFIGRTRNRLEAKRIGHNITVHDYG